MDTIPPSWILTPSERQSIFDTQIAPHLQPHIPPPSPSPPKTKTAVLLVGQTGAGKTRLAPILSSALSSRSPSVVPPAHLIADTYKTLHPFYTACLARSPRQASALAGPDARAWLAMSCAFCVAHSVPSVLVESACRHPDDFCELARIFSGGGYAVRVLVLAVPAPLSRLGILVRYYRRLPEAMSRGLPLRLTPGPVHDESFVGLGRVAEFLDGDGDGDGVAHSVVVVRRDGLVSYRNRRRCGGEEDGKWERGVGAARALEVERTRKLTEDEERMAREDIEQLRKLGDEKVDRQLVEIEALMGRLDGKGMDTTTLEPLRAVDFVRGDW
ncbi:zeta toxin-domain-containing protein [Echria macrotheca]|uniref:Zeta toxin-domain-containing protein n=1 Tax=Echria macrotheca TaxID=438768 RepID=A0AAJ0B2V3_9PEZI|nr:zeta toxin-domain-containing protein [Echria macrotheca]